LPGGHSNNSSPAASLERWAQYTIVKTFFILGFAAAIALGFFLVNPWVFAYYLILLAIATIIVLLLVVASLIGKTKEWKKALLWLAVGYTAALTSYCIQLYSSSKISNERNSVIVALYNYHDRYNKFPSSAKELSIDLSSFRGRYVPDTSLQNFRLYTKDLYGMPWVFNSKDSTWGR
jgi:hypothetical protein